MARGIRIFDGISEWIRKSVGADAENRGEDEDNGEDDENGTTEINNPACSSAASNTDLTVLEE